MNYSLIRDRDIANGPGIRVSVFVSGCKNHCRGCFNPETWDFTYGEKWTPDIENTVLEAAKKPYITGISILGGDLFSQGIKDLYFMRCFLERYRKETERKKSIWIWTGYTFEELLSNRNIHRKTTIDILRITDVLIDGRFDDTLKDTQLKYRGSSNQRVIDLSKIWNSVNIEDVYSGYIPAVVELNI